MSLTIIRRSIPAIAILAASAAYAANAVQEVEYRGDSDSFAVLTTVEGYTPEDHKKIVDLYQQRGNLVFIPVDFPARMFEQNLRSPEGLQDAHWMGYTRTEAGELSAGGDKAPIASTERVGEIRTRPGQLFVTGDLLSYYQQTIIPGAVVDDLLAAYRGPLMDSAAIEKEVARRAAGEPMRIWDDYRGLGYDNALEFLSNESLQMLADAAKAGGARWTRDGDVAECTVPMTDEDARDLKRRSEWWLAHARRTQHGEQTHIHDHGYMHKLERAFAANFQTSCHLSPINGKGLHYTVNLPEAMEAYNSQARLQSDTRDGATLHGNEKQIRYQNYDSMRQLLAADPNTEVNWAIRDRDVLTSKYKAGDLRYSASK